jgi:glycosyltransferase involved in cell wall biosynthesis
MGLSDRVEFLGALPFEELADVYTASSVVCVPSLWQEPFGYAAAEAMAMGCPVVATPSGALPELLSDGRGYVAETFTSDALAAALRLALGDPGAARAAGERARDWSREQLTVDVIGPRYLELFES